VDLTLELCSMSDTLLRSALKLSKAQRILLAERLWDSVAEQAGPPPLTGKQQEELHRRLERLDRTGSQGRPWSQVKKRLMRRKP
jgi:putative addiction module component (TIGR02574 family)